MCTASKDGKYVLSFDIGSTYVKAGIIDLETFRTVSKAIEPAKIIFPASGYAEVSPDSLWRHVINLSSKLSKNRFYEDVSAVIYTAHMAGVLPIDNGYHPLRNIIIWLDERASGLPREVFKGLFKVSGYNIFHLIRLLRLTGGAPSKTGKDPISKIIWMRDYESDLYRSTYKFVDVKGYLILKSTNSIVTSMDEASLTWLADTRGYRAYWSRELTVRYGIDISMLPDIKYSTDVAGYLTEDASSEMGLREGLPVYVGAGDLTASAVGSGAINDYEPHIYLGTSSWLAAHTPKRLLDISHYMGSILSGIPGKYLYIAEQEVAGSALNHISKILGFNGDYIELDRLAGEVEPGSKGLIFIPWLFGERSPIDDPYVRGGYINLSFEHDSKYLIRAVLEGVAYNIRWSMEYFGVKVPLSKGVKAVGGGIKSDLWCQILADVLGIPIIRMYQPEDAGLRGSAVFVAIGMEVYRDFIDAGSRFKVDRIFNPDPERSKVYEKMYSIYKSLYKRLMRVFHSLNK